MPLQWTGSIFGEQAFKEGIQCNAASGWTLICCDWCSHQKRRLGKKHVYIQVKTHLRPQKKMGIRKARRAVLEETSLTDIFDLRLTASATMRKLMLIS